MLACFRRVICVPAVPGHLACDTRDARLRRAIFITESIPYFDAFSDLTPAQIVIFSGFQGLGDDIGLALAKTLPFLPNLASLNLRENRLTDTSLVSGCI